MRISVEGYLMGRDALYPGECTPVVRDNAAKTVERVNALLAAMEASGIELEENPRTKSIVNSGWRPPQINGQVANAAPRSKHMTGEACDLFDPDGTLDDWMMANPDSLASIGLWMEHPSATKGWAHVQVVPPRSGRRVFYP